MKSGGRIADHDAQEGEASAGVPEDASYRLGSLTMLTGFAVRRIHQHLYAGLPKVAEQAGLKPHQFTALSLIVDNPGISQIELSRVLQVKSSNMVPLIDELGSRGLVVRNPSANTRRSYALMATAEGRQLRDHALSLISDYEAEVLAPLTKAERSGLLELSVKLCGP